MRPLLLSLVCLAPLVPSRSRAAVVTLWARPRNGLHRLVSAPSLDGPRRGAWLWAFLNPWCGRPENPLLAADLDNYLCAPAAEAFPKESTPAPERFPPLKPLDVLSPTSPAQASAGAGSPLSDGSGEANRSSSSGLLTLREPGIDYFPTRLPRAKNRLRLARHPSRIFRPPRLA